MRNLGNLGSLQRAIDAGLDPIPPNSIMVVDQDGNIIRVEERDNIARRSRRDLQYIFLHIIVGLIYGIVNNGPVFTLVITFFLFVFSIAIFAILFLALMRFRVQRSAVPVRSEREERASATFVALFTGFVATTSVSLIIEEFPDPAWWLIEFGISYYLDSFLSRYLTERISNREPIKNIEREQYMQYATFAIFRLIFFFIANLALSVMTLALLDPVALWLPVSLGIFVLFWCILHFHKHLTVVRLIDANATIRDKMRMTKYSFVALKPTSRLVWLSPLYYVSLVVMLVCLAILILFPFSDLLCDLFC